MKGGYYCVKYLNVGWWYCVCYVINLNGFYGGLVMINVMYNIWFGWI